MKRIWTVLFLTGCLGGLAQAAAPVKLAFDTYSGYFVSNKFEPDAAESFLVISDQGQFDKVFGVAMAMGDKSHRLPNDAFKSNIVLAAIKRGAAVWEFKVEGATLKDDVFELRYTTTEKKSQSATFACPLIVSIPKGQYMAVRFVENGRVAKNVAADNPPAQSAITLSVLYDNYDFNKRLDAQWGFACLVNGTEKTVLFDTGGKGSVLLENMKNMGVSPGDIETVVISHNHGDHTGGLLAVLEKNGRVTVYLPPSCPKAFVDQTTSGGAKVVVVTKPVEMCKGVFIVGPIGDKIVEQALAVVTRKGLVVITGCSHPGVIEFVKEAKRQLNEEVYMVCGGMHLLKHSESEVKQTIAQLKELGVRKVGPTHCTGDKAIALFKEAFGEQYAPMGVGRITDY